MGPNYEFAFVDTQTPAAWGTWEERNVAVTGGAVGLATEALPAYVSSDAGIDALPPDFTPIDIDIGGCGDLYLLGADGSVYRYDAQKRAGTRLQCLSTNVVEADTGPHDPAVEPTGLCVTDESVFVTSRVGERGGRLHTLSRHLQQTRWIATEPFVRPIGVVGRGATAYVLDAGDDSTDGFLAVVRSPDATAVVDSPLRAPVDVAMGEETPYVLDVVRVEDDGETRSESVVSRLHDDARRLDPVARVPEAFRPSCFEVVNDETLIFGADPTAQSQRSLLRCVLGTSVDEASFERLYTYRRSCRDLLLRRRTDGPGKGLYAVDGERPRIHFLRETDVNARNSRTGQYDAQLTKRFDSGIYGTEWSRAALKMTAADPGTMVRLRYCATESGGLDERAVDWTHLEKPNPRDALLDGAEGRYLWVRLDLLGSEYASPRVESFKAYFARQSYLRYLPAIYREDEQSAAFLDRFLSLFESTFAGLEEELAGTIAYLDPEGIPQAYLPWLGRWLAIATDEAWPDPARRELIAKAPTLFKRRGTRKGLEQVLEIYLRHADDGPAGDRIVDILEYGDLDCITEPGPREPYAKLIPCPQCFLVLVHHSTDDEAVEAIRRIVETDRPAHTAGRAVRLQPWIELDGNSYLGINTVLPERTFVVGRSGLGKDTVLTERERSPQLDVRSKLGEDTLIT